MQYKCASILRYRRGHIYLLEMVIVTYSKEGNVVNNREVQVSLFYLC